MADSLAIGALEPEMGVGQLRLLPGRWRPRHEHRQRLPPAGRFMLNLVSRSEAATRWRGSERSNWSIWLATAAAVAYSVLLPATRIYAIAADPNEPGHAAYAAVAFICYLPLLVWLVVSLAQGNRGWPQWIGLALMAAVIFAAMPLVGVGWVGEIYVLGALTLVTFRPPWSFIAFGALIAAPTPLTAALGRADWALYFTMGILLYSLPLAVGIWMINVVRQLQAARVSLAEQAIVRERLRIDRELSHSVGAGLRAIALSGDRAASLAATDPAAAMREIKGLVRDARSTLFEARQSVRRYREISPRAELETAATLLEAAGFTVHIDGPTGGLPAQADEPERANLRREVARLLGEEVPTAVTIEVETVGDRLHYRLRAVSERQKFGAVSR